MQESIPFFAGCDGVRMKGLKWDIFSNHFRIYVGLCLILVIDQVLLAVGWC